MAHFQDECGHQESDSLQSDSTADVDNRVGVDLPIGEDRGHLCPRERVTLARARISGESIDL